MKSCCIYAYYEKNDLYKENFEYFLKNGILDDVDYYIVINGKCSVQIPERKNITVFRRQNEGYDFGAYSYALKNIHKNYDYYFFLNTSVRGPYSEKRWIDKFLPLFKKDVKVVGTTINIFNQKSIFGYDLSEMYGKKNVYPHVQSMFFGIDKEYLKYLMDKDFFNESEMIGKDIQYIIVHKEIGLSQLALKNGWNINCILPKYTGIDYRKIEKDINPTSREGDPYYKDAYFGNNIKKEDVIFWKGYRLQ